MKRQKILLVSSLIAALLIGSAGAKANTDAELRAGYYTDVEEGFVGGGLRTDLGGSWNFNPNLEWVLTNGYDYMTVNGDVHYDLNNYSPGPAIWIGAGAAFVHTEVDRGPLADDVSDNDLGMNLFGGVGAKQGAVRPFMQLKGRIADNSEASIAMGLRF